MATLNKAFADLVPSGTPGSNKSLKQPVKPPPSANPARFIIIGAGERGIGYAGAIDKATNGVVAAVADPLKFKREIMGKNHIWHDGQPSEGQSFNDWQEFLKYELARRKRVEAGEENVPAGVDGAFVCVMDEMHREVLVGLAPLGLHIMCEKPLSPSLESCLDIYKALKPGTSSKVFSIGHVLRYSPHNMMLRKLLVEQKVIGDITSVVHTEPVGWWHFTHSYVRGNWRNDKTTGPSLLTKCCHDVDLLAWILCSPEKPGQGPAHLPSTISSTGGVQLYKKSRKPKAAGAATNCFKCPLGDSGCKYSAKHIYSGDRYMGLGTGNTDWPVRVVVHDLEDYGSEERAAKLQSKLEEDYDESTPASEISSRNWFGRCVFESDNNVCDDQFVTFSWPETPEQPAKRAALHMVSQTIKQCDRYTNFYGELGEIYADSTKIVIEDLESGAVKTMYPEIEDLGHGGGDTGLTRQFVSAVDKVKNEGWEAKKAQYEYIQCTLEECIRSHAFVFAAEEARLGEKVLNYTEWWDGMIQKHNLGDEWN